VPTSGENLGESSANKRHRTKKYG